MHLVALVESHDHVCCRYRLRAFEPALAAAGHTLETHLLPQSFWERLRGGADFRDADAIILQRRLLSPWQIRLLRLRARKLIFDFDDAVFIRDSYAPKGPHSPQRVARFLTTARLADILVCGNDWLRAQAQVLVPTTPMVTIPTCVSPSSYPLAAHDRADAGVRLVWIGSASTLQGLQAVRPMLETLGQQLRGLALKLICDEFLTLDHLAVQPCVWAEDTEAAEIAAADIGISWLPDDEWSRGKCGLKVLQYMAAGLPVVANPVGVQSDMVRHGETGFLATTVAEWLEAVETLSRDPELRRRMGAAGRARVEAEFSVTAGARLWLEMLDRLREARAA